MVTITLKNKGLQNDLVSSSISAKLQTTCVSEILIRIVRNNSQCENELDSNSKNYLDGKNVLVLDLYSDSQIVVDYEKRDSQVMPQNLEVSDNKSINSNTSYENQFPVNKPSIRSKEINSDIATNSASFYCKNEIVSTENNSVKPLISNDTKKLPIDIEKFAELSSPDLNRKNKKSSSVEISNFNHINPKSKHNKTEFSLKDKTEQGANNLLSIEPIVSKARAFEVAEGVYQEKAEISQNSLKFNKIESDIIINNSNKNSNHESKILTDIDNTPINQLFIPQNKTVSNSKAKNYKKNSKNKIIKKQVLLEKLDNIFNENQSETIKQKISKLFYKNQSALEDFTFIPSISKKIVPIKPAYENPEIPSNSPKLFTNDISVFSSLSNTSLDNNPPTADLVDLVKHPINPNVNTNSNLLKGNEPNSSYQSLPANIDNNNSNSSQEIKIAPQNEKTFISYKDGYNTSSILTTKNYQLAETLKTLPTSKLVNSKLETITIQTNNSKSDSTIRKDFCLNPIPSAANFNIEDQKIGATACLKNSTNFIANNLKRCLDQEFILARKSPSNKSEFDYNLEKTSLNYASLQKNKNQDHVLNLLNTFNKNTIDPNDDFIKLDGMQQISNQADSDKLNTFKINQSPKQIVPVPDLTSKNSIEQAPIFVDYIDELIYNIERTKINKPNLFRAFTNPNPAIEGTKSNEYNQNKTYDLNYDSSAAYMTNLNKNHSDAYEPNLSPDLLRHKLTNLTNSGSVLAPDIIEKNTQHLELSEINSVSSNKEILELQHPNKTIYNSNDPSQIEPIVSTPGLKLDKIPSEYSFDALVNKDDCNFSQNSSSKKNILKKENSKLGFNSPALSNNTEDTAVNGTVSNIRIPITKICVDNISKSTTRVNLIDFFKRFGHISGINFPKKSEKKNKNLAIIKFFNENQALSSLAADKTLLNSSNISVKLDTPANFVAFISEKSTAIANPQNNNNALSINSTAIYPTKIIRIDNLNPDTSKEKVADYASKFGEFFNINLPINPKDKNKGIGSAFVVYKLFQSSERALFGFQDFTLDGYKLSSSYSKTDSIR
ncbi:hypothetical protein AYI70_g1285 [Smittium culicis]|uniref:RRM domain-containing protein n=1 Tax=Smittium culicis TaxID=133412 RepID=A0A1R1YD90_9FUNG|nr:hypothetical protein AYI70_g1285 [Smittium culicis]